MRKALTLVAGAVTVIGATSAVVYTTSSTPVPTHTTKSPVVVKTNSVKPVFNKSLYSTSDPSSLWVVVNKQHPLPSAYVPTNLVLAGNNQALRSDAAAALAQMLAGAKTAGFVVVPVSGYRSYATQAAVYSSEVQTNGRAAADGESAQPGFSEHQTGLAVDLGSGTCSITNCFGTLPAGQWIAAHAYKYGFIQRYPQGLTNVTGYQYEPWHYRFVGVSLATELHSQKVQTLEQFFGVSGGTTYKQ